MYKRQPQYSPDGKYIAWQSMERDGYEADLNRLFIMNIETGEKRFVSKACESNVDAFLWNKDSQSIYFIGCLLYTSFPTAPFHGHYSWQTVAGWQARR